MSWQSPFVPGARVAIVTGYDRKTYTEGFVDRVYKSGNFTLRDYVGRQQWRPVRNSNRACCTRKSRWGTHLILWDENVNAEINAAMLSDAVCKRWQGVTNRVMSIHHTQATDELCNAVETALDACKKGLKP
jgi:hypothetical protein